MATESKKIFEFDNTSAVKPDDLFLLNRDTTQEFNITFEDMERNHVENFPHDDATAVSEAAVEEHEQTWDHDSFLTPGDINNYIVTAYDIAGASFGNPTPETVLLRFITVRDFYFRVNFNNSQASAEIAPDSTTIFDIKKNDILIGTITFEPDSHIGVFDSDNVEYSFTVRDILTIESQTFVDPGISGLQWTLTGILIN